MGYWQEERGFWEIVSNKREESYWGRGRRDEMRDEARDVSQQVAELRETLGRREGRSKLGMKRGN